MNRLSTWLGLSLLALCAATSLPAIGEDKVPDIIPLHVENPQTADNGYAGHWLWAEGDDRFRLTLIQKGSALKGFHSVEHLGGSKRDVAGNDQQPSIEGKLHGSSAIVRFKSGIPGSEGYGHARLTLRGRYLYWQLMDSTGEHYMPANAILIRQER